jgi:hypothetical protein
VQCFTNNYILNWDAKYTYNFWRPVTAIRNGDIDGNDATERDAAWTPLSMTPLHPEYPSQATINATVASAILESVSGPVTAIPLAVTDIADAKRTRHFNSIADMVEEQKSVRIWGGVHYRSAIDTGADMGRKIAAYMIDNAPKPVRWCPRDHLREWSRSLLRRRDRLPVKIGCSGWSVRRAGNPARSPGPSDR